MKRDVREGGVTNDHKWSGAPGMYCLACGNESPLEDALACADCKTDDNGVVVTFCPMHHEWATAIEGCPPDRQKIRAFNERWNNYRHGEVTS